MRAIISLRWKFLAWFFVNLVVLGGVLMLFLHAQFQVGIGSLLAGPANARLDAVARPLIAELRGLPAEEWGPVLERLTGALRKPGGHGVRSAIWRNEGTYITGEIRALPPEILTHLSAHERAQPPAPSAAPPPPKPRGASQREPPPFREPPPGGERLEKFMLAAGEPRLYWAGVRLGFVERAPGVRPRFVTLLLASDSLRGDGLFFQYTPWLLLGGGMVLVSVLLWLPFMHGLTRDLGRMTSTAEEIAQGRFEPAPDLRRRDELGRLGRALRRMSARLEEFVTGQRRFLGDTAHELRSPLARLEVTLSIIEQSAAPAHRAYAERALAEVRHISELVGELLTFSKAGGGEKNLALKPVALAELAARVIARETKDTGLVALDVPAGLRALAEPDLLARALGNVVRNALRYASPVSADGGHSFRPMLGSDGRPAGPVTISARAENGHIILTVSDSGPGVPPDALDQLFDPFFRPDTARTRETGGTGLGLAIVKTCIEACGGRVAVRNREPSGLQLDFTLQNAA